MHNEQKQMKKHVHIYAYDEPVYIKQVLHITQMYASSHLSKQLA